MCYIFLYVGNGILFYVSSLENHSRLKVSL